MFNPSRYRIICIGKIKKNWIKSGIDLYLKRLPGVPITEIRDSNTEKESKAILSNIKKDELLIALTERGEKVTSIQFSERLNSTNNKRLVFAIGGTNGFSAEIHKSTHWLLSLSSMTYPHEIARLLLIEQLYRAHSINQRSPYHRE